jgi:hypothetical protein
MNITELINTLFLLILVMFGNYLYEIFPRQLNNFLSKSIYSKHILVFFLIFFSSELIHDVENKSPFESFYIALILYVFYIFFNKTNLYQSILILILLITNFTIIRQQNYLKHKNKDYLYLNEYIDVVSYIILGVMIISFLTYLNKQLTEQEKFSFFKFWFGTKIKELKK